MEGIFLYVIKNKLIITCKSLYLRIFLGTISQLRRCQKCQNSSLQNQNPVWKHFLSGNAHFKENIKKPFKEQLRVLLSPTTELPKLKSCALIIIKRVRYQKFNLTFNKKPVARMKHFLVVTIINQLSEKIDTRIKIIIISWPILSAN